VLSPSRYPELALAARRWPQGHTRGRIDLRAPSAPTLSSFVRFFSHAPPLSASPSPRHHPQFQPQPQPHRPRRPPRGEPRGAPDSGLGWWRVEVRPALYLLAPLSR
jgi:hypothetical protein